MYNLHVYCTCKHACILYRHSSHHDVRYMLQDEVQMDEFALGDDMHHRPAEALFDFMAEKLVAFAKRIDKM